MTRPHRRQVAKLHERAIKYETHVSLNCFFSPEELERLKSIKSDPSWLPREKRRGFKPMMFPTGKRALGEYRKLKAEFDRICMGLESKGEDQ